MIRVNFSFGHLDRPDSTTRWSFDIPSASDRDASSAEDAKRLSPEGVAARAREGIAKDMSHD